ncbi:MAG: malonate transporter subunit MadL [Clostridia bacterium]|nr:malonate transporter subunit MadL [Clostridia bacterium]
MEIYGLGIVAICMFVGSFIGHSLGSVLGVSGNVGGVGIAMLILVLLSNYYEKKGKAFHERTQNGIKFLSALYIPIVVAMAARQNVVAAFEGGIVAFAAGGIATIGAMFLVPLISKLSKENNE